MLRPFDRLPIPALSVLCLALAVPARPAGAADILVTSTADNVTAGDCDCTLREAVANANADSDTTLGDCAAGSGADAIFVPADAAPYLILSHSFTDAAGVSIIGDGVGASVISTNGITVGAGTSMLIRGVTLEHRGSGSAHKITVAGTASLDLAASRLTVNRGLAISAGGVATVFDTTFDGNSGGAAIKNYGSLELTNSTISGNDGGAFVTGALLNEGAGVTARLRHVTITDNEAHIGGIFNKSGAVVEVSNSIIGGNRDNHFAGTEDCWDVTSLGYNVFGEGGVAETCPTGGLGDILLSGPITTLLEPLADNGGQAPTHALATGSPALDHIPSGTSACGTLITADQRGAVRPHGGSCDVGAYEEVGAVPVTDTDGDGVPDATDNCPFNANPGQEDFDGNARGDACDPGATPLCGPTCTDDDGDGYGSPGDASCDNGAAEDCNDGDANVHPGAPEICNNVDDDCVGGIDDGIAPVPTTCGQGACAGNTGQETCVAGSMVDDCDPLAGATAEVCDVIDNDCDGTVDDGDGSGGADVCPQLWIADLIPAAELETVDVDVALDTNGNPVAATTFSVDYDEVCLSFDDTDGDADNLPDDLAFSLPAGFSVTAVHDFGDSSGEIDVSIADLAPPISTLPDGAVMTVTFTSICEPAIDATIVAPAGFSNGPPATFSDQAAVDVPGTSADGSAEIWPGPRGDCNSTGALSAADLIADALEIFDGDGTFWADVVGSTYVGSPVGCDANDDTAVDAGDISCTILLIFGGSCGGGGRGMAVDDGVFDSRTSPVLGLERGSFGKDGKLWIPVVFSAGSHDVSSTAFSLNLMRGLRFDPFDGDGDGLPDSVRFPQGRPDLVDVRYDARDRRGEIDLTIATFDGVLRDGVLLEIAVEQRRHLAAADRWRSAVRFSKAPAASFGDLFGRAVPGRAIVVRGRK